jgi:hypothetical protein
VLTKANINTSRSNIKNQQSNAQVIEEEQSAGVSGLQGIDYMISPNPAKDVITINSPKNIDGKYWITNLNGEKIASGTISGNSISVDLRDSESGVYFISIETAGVICSKQFIKQ